MNYKTIILGVLVILAIAGAYMYPKAVISFGSATGTTFNSAKIALVNVAPATSAASSTSILNTDDSARWVEAGYATCTGTGSESLVQASLKFTLSTTSVASQGLQGNTNITASIPVSTTTAFSNNATTTSNSTVLAYWPSGTYMTILTSATTTAACTVGVAYNPS